MRCSRGVLATAAASILLLPGCSRRPQPFELGSSIPLADGRLIVTRFEVHPDGDQADLILFFTWTGSLKHLHGWFPQLKMTVTDSLGKRHRSVPAVFYSSMQPVPEEVYNLAGARSARAFAATIEQQSRTIADAMTGPVHDREALRGSTAGMERRIEQVKADLDAGRNPERWVHKFRVPAQSRSFALLVRNPSPQPNQARYASVVLER